VWLVQLARMVRKAPQEPLAQPAPRGCKVLLDRRDRRGPAGVAGTNGSGFDFLNAFDSNTTYATDDVVTYDGSTYVAITPSAGPNNAIEP
jgi:hypothetical protein